MSWKLTALVALVAAFLLFLLWDVKDTQGPRAEHSRNTDVGSGADVAGLAGRAQAPGEVSTDGVVASTAFLRIVDESGHPLSGATVTYGDQESAERFTGTSDAEGQALLTSEVFGKYCIADVSFPGRASRTDAFWADGVHEVRLESGCEVWLLHPDPASLDLDEPPVCAFVSGGRMGQVELSGSRTRLGRFRAGAFEILACHPFASGRVRYALPSDGRIEITVQASATQDSEIRLREAHDRMDGAHIVIGCVSMPALPQLRARPSLRDPAEQLATPLVPGEYQFLATSKYGCATGSFTTPAAGEETVVEFEWAVGCTLEVRLPGELPPDAMPVDARLYLVPKSVADAHFVVHGDAPGSEAVRDAVSLLSGPGGVDGFLWPHAPSQQAGTLRWAGLPRGLSATAVVAMDGRGDVSVARLLSKDFVSVALPDSATVGVDVVGSPNDSCDLDVIAPSRAPVGPRERSLLHAHVSLPRFSLTAPTDHSPVVLRLKTRTAFAEGRIEDWSQGSLRIVLKPRPRGLRRVQALDVRGAVIPGLGIQFSSSDGEVRWRMTDEEGRCEVEMPADVRCWASTFGTQFTSARIEVPTDIRAEIVTARTGTLEIRYRGAPQVLEVRTGAVGHSRTMTTSRGRGTRWNFFPGATVSIPRLGAGAVSLVIQTVGEQTRVLYEGEIVILEGESRLIEVADG